MAFRGRHGMRPFMGARACSCNQRTHEKVVAITRRLVIAVLAVPTIDAPTPATARSETAAGNTHHRPRAMTPHDAALLVSRHFIARNAA